MLAASVAAYLAAQGLGTFSEPGGGTIFVDRLPSTPDTCLAIYERGGGAASAANPWDTPNIQVLVRGTTDPRTGRALAESVYNALHGWRDAPLSTGGVHVVSLQCNASGPEPIGPDANGRFEYTLNFTAIAVSTSRSN